jgi:hypothetical protein
MPDAKQSTSSLPLESIEAASARNKPDKDLFDSFSALGEDSAESSVEFAFAAQSEIVLGKN